MWRAVCLKGLQKEPARRYAEASELAEDLQRFRQRVPVLARPAGWLKQSYRWCRLNPATALLLALVVKQSDMPMTMSRTVSEAVKCFSM